MFCTVLLYMILTFPTIPTLLLIGFRVVLIVTLIIIYPVVTSIILVLEKKRVFNSYSPSCFHDPLSKFLSVCLSPCLPVCLPACLSVCWLDQITANRQQIGKNSRHTSYSTAPGTTLTPLLCSCIQSSIIKHSSRHNTPMHILDILDIVDIVDGSYTYHQMSYRESTWIATATISLNLMHAINVKIIAAAQHVTSYYCYGLYKCDVCIITTVKLLRSIATPHAFQPRVEV